MSNFADFCKKNAAREPVVVLDVESIDTTSKMIASIEGWGDPAGSGFVRTRPMSAGIGLDNQTINATAKPVVNPSRADAAATFTPPTDMPLNKVLLSGVQLWINRAGNIEWTLGKQYVDYFYSTSTGYSRHITYVQHNNRAYRTIRSSRASADNEPGVGAQWTRYWQQYWPGGADFSSFNVIVTQTETNGTITPLWVSKKTAYDKPGSITVEAPGLILRAGRAYQLWFIDQCPTLVQPADATGTTAPVGLSFAPKNFRSASAINGTIGMASSVPFAVYTTPLASIDFGAAIGSGTVAINDEVPAKCWVKYELYGSNDGVAIDYLGEVRDGQVVAGYRYYKYKITGANESSIMPGIFISSIGIESIGTLTRQDVEFTSLGTDFVATADGIELKPGVDVEIAGAKVDAKTATFAGNGGWMNQVQVPFLFDQGADTTGFITVEAGDDGTGNPLYVQGGGVDTDVVTVPGTVGKWPVTMLYDYYRQGGNLDFSSVIDGITYITSGDSQWFYRVDANGVITDCGTSGAYERMVGNLVKLPSGRLVVVRDKSVIASDDNGITWNVIGSMPETAGRWHLVYKGGQLISYNMAYNPAKYCTSSDNGVTWTGLVQIAAGGPGSAGGTSQAFLNDGNYIIARDASGNTWYSADGKTGWQTWAAPSVATGIYTPKLYFMGGKYIYVWRDTYVYTATVVGGAWTAATSANNKCGNGLAFDGTNWVGLATGSGTTTAYTSTDFVNWTSHSTTYYVRGVWWNGTNFVASTYENTTPNFIGTLISSNGVAWTRVVRAFVGKGSVASNGTVFIRTVGTTAIYKSSNAKDWTTATSPGTLFDMNKLSAANGYVFCWVGTAASATLKYTTDGVTWSAVPGTYTITGTIQARVWWDGTNYFCWTATGTCMTTTSLGIAMVAVSGPINEPIGYCDDGSGTKFWWYNDSASPINLRKGESVYAALSSIVKVNATGAGQINCIEWGGAKLIGTRQALTQTSDNLMISSDHGVTWTTIPTSAGYYMNRYGAIMKQGNGIMVLMTDRGSNGLVSIMRSFDGGTTWSKEGSASYTGAYDFGDSNYTFTNQAACGGGYMCTFGSYGIIWAGLEVDPTPDKYRGLFTLNLSPSIPAYIGQNVTVIVEPAVDNGASTVIQDATLKAVTKAMATTGTLHSDVFYFEVDSEARLMLSEKLPPATSIKCKVSRSNDGVDGWIELGEFIDGSYLTTGAGFYQLHLDYTGPGYVSPAFARAVLVAGAPPRKTWSTHAGLPSPGAMPYLVRVGSLSNTVQPLKLGTIGEISVDMLHRQATAHMLATGYLRGKSCKLKLGMVGLSESDYVPVITGTFYDYEQDMVKDVFNIKIRDIMQTYLKVKIPIVAHSTVGPIPTTSITWDGIHFAQIILDLLDQVRVQDRYIDRDAIEALKTDPRFPSPHYDLTRTLNMKQRETVSKLLEDISALTGVWLIPMPNGKLTPVVYDKDAAPVDELDASTCRLQKIAGGYQNLFTRALVYYRAKRESQLANGLDDTTKPYRTGGGDDDYWNVAAGINQEAEVKWGLNTQEMLDEGLDKGSFEKILYDTWGIGRKDTWVLGMAYQIGSIVYQGGNCFEATAISDGSAATQPGVGASWQTCWKIIIPPLIQALLTRLDLWFANPKRTARIDNIPPWHIDVQVGSVVTIKNLKLPIAASDWGQLSDMKALVVGRDLDPATLSLAWQILEV